jgi:hypothetical protein
MNRALIAAIVGMTAACAHGDTLFKNVADNGFFTPFNSHNTSVRYGDSGWLSNFQPDGFTVTGITLGLLTYGGTSNGSTDITFTFNNGDPSGQVFGNGATLYSTTIRNVALNVDETSSFATFDLFIPMPNIQTLGGFNNVGFSVGVSNFNFDGSFGFQCSSAYGQQVGFYTSNASYFNGSSWSLFSFGGGPYGVANFVAEIVGAPVPAPSAAGILRLGLFAGSRRRR